MSLSTSLIDDSHLKDLFYKFLEGTSLLTVSFNTNLDYSCRFLRAMRSLKIINSLTTYLVDPKLINQRFFRLKYSDSRLMRWTDVYQWQYIFHILDNSTRDEFKELLPGALYLRDLLQKLYNLVLKIEDFMSNVVFDYDQTKHFKPHDWNSLLNELRSLLLEIDSSSAQFEWQEVVQRNNAFIYSIEQLEVVQEMAILYSYSLHWCRYYGLFTLDDVEECTPVLMLGLPRISLIVSIRLLQSDLLRPTNSDDISITNMLFSSFIDEIDYLWRQLPVLSELEFLRLALCLTQEENAQKDYLVRIPQLLCKKIRQLNEFSHFSDVLSQNNLLIDLMPLYRVVCQVADSLLTNQANANRMMLQAVHCWHVDEEKLPEILRIQFDKVFSPPFQNFRDSDKFDFISEKPIANSKKSKINNNSKDLPQLSYLSTNKRIILAIDAVASLEFNERVNESSKCAALADQAESEQLEPTMTEMQRILNFPSMLECRVLRLRPWQKDTECDQCSHCKVEFHRATNSGLGLAATALLIGGLVIGKRRRHHCRRCGFIFCSECCGEKFKRNLPTLGLISESGLPHKVCVECAELLPAPDKSIPFLPSADIFNNSSFSLS